MRDALYMKPGHCAVCESSIQPFISFGKQPIANGFITEKQISAEYFFELKVAFCAQCSMVQLMEQPDREQMFNDTYAFFTGTSKYMALHFQAFAADVTKHHLTGQDPFVVEIGSNDGTMLKNFARDGIRHLGVEPSANVAEVATRNGINTLNRFFDRETAKAIVEKNGQADALLAANVMCHIPYLHSVIEGAKVLLKPTGVMIFEDPYLGDIIEKTSYDQIYDEHMFLFSVSSIQNLFSRHGMEVFDAVPQGTHGGSMRYCIGFKGAHPVSSRVGEALAKEKAQGLARAETYERFRLNCEKSRSDLMDLLKRLKAEKKRVVGYAATSKSTTVINYCGITPDLLEFISDTTPIKQGKVSPGKHIPVLPHERFKSDYPEYALLFGWNHKAEIIANERDFAAAGGKWIVYVPTVGIL